MRSPEQDIARGVTDAETRLDYVTRTDEQPVYVGRAPAGFSTTWERWVIERITYDTSNRPTHKQVRIGAWDDRASLVWEA